MFRSVVSRNVSPLLLPVVSPSPLYLTPALLQVAFRNLAASATRQASTFKVLGLQQVAIGKYLCHM